jgi:hypothetical protein
MANSNDARRLRDVFPTFYALGLLIRGSSRRSAKYVQESVALPSAWTTAVLAGGLALFLSVLLLLVDPPPEASLSSMQPQGLLSPATGEPLPLEVQIVHGQFAPGWEERLEELWVSRPVIDVVQPSTLLAFDQWNAARTQPPVLTTPDAQEFEPYFLTAEFVHFDQLTAAISADELPAAGSDPVALRGLSVAVERSSAVPSASGGIEYALHVRNAGYDVVDHVRVIETLPRVERVIDVVPPAVISPDGALVWELSAIGPREERVLTITLMPGTDTTLDTIAALDIESQFTVATLVRPAGNLELFSPEPEPADLALPEMPFESETAPAFIDEPIVSAPAEEPVVLPEETAAEPAPTDPFDPFGSEPAAPPEEPVIPSWILEEDDGPPARNTRPSTTLPAADEPVIEESIPVEPEMALPEEPEEDQGWSSTPRPVPLDPVQAPQPLLSLRTRSQTTAAAGDVVTTVFEISNTGDGAADEVLLTVHLAPGLKHKHGDTVEHHIATLGPGETRTARLYTRAAATGVARFDAVLSHAGESDDEQSHAVQIAVPNSRIGR